MAGPPKPWEGMNQNAARLFVNSGPQLGLRQVPNPPPGPNFSCRPPLNLPPPNLPPPLRINPPMPYRQFPSMDYYDPYSTSYASRTGLYNRAGGYSYAGMYGRPPHLNQGNNWFSEMAEENSRSAFQSIETVVESIASLSMMVESTYHALYSSFRAVLGVADNFSRLRQVFGTILSTMYSLRLIQWFYRRLLSILRTLGMRKQTVAGAWSEAAGANASTAVSTTTNWPIVTFIGMLMAAPYLVAKLMPKVFAKTGAETKWNPERDPRQIAVAAHSFTARNAWELSITSGQTLYLPSYSQFPGAYINGWAQAATKDFKMGYIPLNYLLKKSDLAATCEGKSEPSVNALHQSGESKEESNTAEPKSTLSEEIGP